MSSNPDPGELTRTHAFPTRPNPVRGRGAPFPRFREAVKAAVDERFGRLSVAMYWWAHCPIAI